MAKAKRVRMRHDKLSKQRDADVTAEVREDQVPIHEKSGWAVVKDAKAATKQPATKQEA